jgi:hypothetical protein
MWYAVNLGRFRPLGFNPYFYQAGWEYSASQEKIVVFFQCIQSLIQAFG